MAKFKASQEIKIRRMTRKDPNTGKSNYPTLKKKITNRNYQQNQKQPQNKNYQGRKDDKTSK